MSYMDEFDNSKCVYNDNKYCSQVGKCENCEYYPARKLYEDAHKVFNIVIIESRDRDPFQSTGNEQLSFIDGVKYEKTKRRKK